MARACKVEVDDDTCMERGNPKSGGEEKRQTKTNMGREDQAGSVRLVPSEHIIVDRSSCQIKRTLKAGKLTPRILKLFLATGKEEILSMIQALNIQLVLTPVLPTRCSEKF